MRAVILAAGRGSRMGNATDIKPKCLTVLAGKPLLEWQYEAVTAAGIDDITVVKGYRPETLESNKYKCALNPGWAETNMVMTMLCAGRSEKDTIVSYSDIVYSPAHIKALAESAGDIVITADILWHELWKLRFDNPMDDAETFKSEAGRLLEIGGKTNDINDIQAQYMGLLKFTKKGWERAERLVSSLPEEKAQKLDMTAMLRLLLLEDAEINVIKVEGKWCEVDNQHDLRTYEQMLKTKNWKHNWQ